MSAVDVVPLLYWVMIVHKGYGDLKDGHWPDFGLYSSLCQTVNGDGWCHISSTTCLLTLRTPSTKASRPINTLCSRWSWISQSRRLGMCCVHSESTRNVSHPRLFIASKSGILVYDESVTPYRHIRENMTRAVAYMSSRRLIYICTVSELFMSYKLNSDIPVFRRNDSCDYIATDDSKERDFVFTASVGSRKNKCSVTKLDHTGKTLKWRRLPYKSFYVRQMSIIPRDEVVLIHGGSVMVYIAYNMSIVKRVEISGDVRFSESLCVDDMHDQIFIGNRQTIARSDLTSKRFTDIATFSITDYVFEMALYRDRLVVRTEDFDHMSTFYSADVVETEPHLLFKCDDEVFNFCAFP